MKLSVSVFLYMQNAGDVESTLNILSVLDELLSAGKINALTVRAVGKMNKRSAFQPEVTDYYVSSLPIFWPCKMLDSTRLQDTYFIFQFHLIQEKKHGT